MTSTSSLLRFVFTTLARRQRIGDGATWGVERSGGRPVIRATARRRVDIFSVGQSKSMDCATSLASVHESESLSSTSAARSLAASL